MQVIIHDVLFSLNTLGKQWGGGEKSQITLVESTTKIPDFVYIHHCFSKRIRTCTLNCGHNAQEGLYCSMYNLTLNDWAMHSTSTPDRWFLFVALARHSWSTFRYMNYTHSPSHFRILPRQWNSGCHCTARIHRISMEWLEDGLCIQ